MNWLWRIALWGSLLGSILGPGCSPPTIAQRSCETDADCVNFAPEIHCYKGRCSTQECEPGLQRACYEGAPATRNTGSCRDGLQSCLRDGVWSLCTDQWLPYTEVCDRVDNDCNGKVDDGIDCRCQPVGQKRNCYTGPPKTARRSVCKGGVQVCEQDNLWGRCLEQTLPEKEVCDDVDNDCNGLIDDHFDCKCEVDKRRDCYTGPADTLDVGGCQAGVQFCRSNETWSLCHREALPQEERCNGLDDDCDGVVDEDCDCRVGTQRSCYDGPAGTEGIGACKAGLQLCQTGGTWGDCVGQQKPEAKEVCDNLRDDNCNGSVDESCACPVVGATEPCYGGPARTRDQGRCKAGTRLCQNNNQWSTCSGATLPGKEVCGNRLDDDCDGAVDEDSTEQPCGCPQGLVQCGDACVDLKSDKGHCGTCDNGCTTSARCVDGKCQEECNAGQTLCADTCVDLLTDKGHCGACGQSCTPSQVCENGRCRCPGTLTLCAGQCVDTKASVKHCGGCLKACKDSERCEQGQCQGCPQNTTLCGSRCCAPGFGCEPQSQACVALATSREHCGAIGTQCTGAQQCCEGRCVDIFSDPGHCSACGNACAVGDGCENGMCRVPERLLSAGSFAMGSRSGFPAALRTSGEERHQVTLTRAFLIWKHEVTRRTFVALMGYAPSTAGTVCPGDDCPVINVNWHEALAFCNALSTARKLETCYNCTGQGSSVRCKVKARFAQNAYRAYYDCKGYRLPTEAEWEYAARAGSSKDTYNGDFVGKEQDDARTLDPIAWFYGNSKRLREVMTKKPNAWGLFDMLGNVGEWVFDPYHVSYGTLARFDPVALPGSDASRTVRGGGWRSVFNYVRAAARIAVMPTQQQDEIGLRPVRKAP